MSQEGKHRIYPNHLGTMSSETTPPNKKRKESDTAGNESEGKRGNGKPSYEDLEAMNLEKDKKIKELEKAMEAFKSHQNNGAANNDEDDFSDIEELDTSDSWNNKFVQLRQFRMVNGHCNVPSSAGNFYQWVNNQRRAYNNVKQGKSGLKISPERIVMLEGLGFNWGKKYPAPPSWDESLEELKKFRKAMNHCNIHMDPKSPSALAKWVSTQRSEYKRFDKGCDSLLSLEQIGKLNEIEFNWKGPRLSS